jgi:multicomponent Na+:H+ antiporter subunit D
MTGIGVRAAFLPFHIWLPEAHAYAPHPVSALLSGLVIKISFLAIWRIVQMLDLVSIQRLLLWIGAATALGGVMWALAQTDSKQLLAWHSISQIGYIVASFGAGTPLALVASYAHILNHALFKSLLFLSIGGVIHVTGERNLKRLGNLASVLPLLAILFLVGACSIAGIPPFNGFISKKLILASLKTSPPIYAALWIAGVGTVASFVKLSAIFRNTPQGKAAGELTTSLPRLAYVPLTLLGALCVGTGIWGRAVIAWMFGLLFGTPPPYLSAFYSLSSLINTALTVALGIALYRGIRHKTGQRITDTLRSLHLSLNASLLLLVAGFVLLSLLSLYQ